MTRGALAAAAMAVVVAGGVLWLAVAALFVPGLLLFPHHRMVGDTPVHASAPLTPEIEAVIRRADARMRTSPLYRRGMTRRPVYLTGGGFRWRVLSLGAGGAFALTRPLSSAVVVNRSSVEHDAVWNGAPLAARRTLSGVIAHEKTHMMIRARFGVMADTVWPRWLIEGYCDHVAGASTLSDDQAARMIAADQTSPALFYYQGRKRVEAELAANGGSVDALFRQASPAARRNTSGP